MRLFTHVKRVPSFKVVHHQQMHNLSLTRIALEGCFDPAWQLPSPRNSSISSSSVKVTLQVDLTSRFDLVITILLQAVPSKVEKGNCDIPECPNVMSLLFSGVPQYNQKLSVWYFGLLNVLLTLRVLFNQTDKNQPFKIEHVNCTLSWFVYISMLEQNLLSIIMTSWG